MGENGPQEHQSVTGEELGQINSFIGAMVNPIFKKIFEFETFLVERIRGQESLTKLPAFLDQKTLDFL
jgi:hypothetical protein